MKTLGTYSIPAVIGLAAAVSAQGDPTFECHSVFIYPSYDLDDPEPPRKLLAGQFDDDALVDGVLMVGNNLAYIGALLCRDAITFLGDGSARLYVEDFDVAPHLVGVGGGLANVVHSAIVYVNAEGLQASYLVAGPQSPVQYQKFMGAQLVAAAPWTGALRVRSADIDADQVTDFVGVASNGSTVLITNGATLQTTSLTGSSPVVGLEVLRWNTDALHEIAILRTDSLQIVECDGDPVQSQTFATDVDGKIVTLKGMARDRLAWLGHSGTQATISVCRLGAANDGPYSLGSVAPSAMSAGDVDRDRDSDVLFSTEDSNAPYLLRNNQPVEPMLNPSLGMELVDGAWRRIVLDENSQPRIGGGGMLATNDGTGNTFQPLMTDLNGDGYCDTVLASYVPGVVTDHDLALLVMLAARPIPPYEPPPESFVNCDPISDAIYSARVDVIGSAPDFDLMITMAMKYNTRSCPAAANALGVTVWKQENPTAPLQTAALHNYEIPITRQIGVWDPTAANPCELRVVIDGEPLTGTPTASGFCSAEVLWVEIKTMNTNSDPAGIYDTRVIALDMSTETYDVLILDGGTPVCYPDTDNDICELEATDGPIYIVRRPRLASVGSGMPPYVPPAVPAQPPGYFGAVQGN